jgi:hypothetical protein
MAAWLAIHASRLTITEKGSHDEDGTPYERYAVGTERLNGGVPEIVSRPIESVTPLPI